MEKNKITSSIKEIKINIDENIDKEINELVDEQASYIINDIEDFFSYYESIKNDISRYSDQNSLQYLYNSAIELTDGNLII
jgi:hypothetical protein